MVKVSISYIPISLSLARMPKIERHLRVSMARKNVVSAVNRWFYSR